MDLEKISIDFKGNFKYLEEIKKDLIAFPSDTFGPHGKIYNIQIKVENEEESIIIQPSEADKSLSMRVPEGASEIIIDHTNRSTNFKYNKKTYYVFAENRDF